jgi:putative transposase
LIDQLREQESVEVICTAFDIAPSSYCEHKQRPRAPDVERLLLRSKIKELFRLSRNSTGTRSLEDMMRELGFRVGRYKVGRLTDEENLPNRQFDVATPDQAWCGDISYIREGNCWHYLAVVLDLHRRRVVG